jgi:hypothetical protein
MSGFELCERLELLRLDDGPAGFTGPPPKEGVFFEGAMDETSKGI